VGRAGTTPVPPDAALAADGSTLAGASSGAALPARGGGSRCLSIGLDRRWGAAVSRTRGDPGMNDRPGKPDWTILSIGLGVGLAIVILLILELFFG